MGVAEQGNSLQDLLVALCAGVAWFSAASLLLPVALSEPVRAAGLALPAVLLARMCVVSHCSTAALQTSSTVLVVYACSTGCVDSFAALQPQLPQPSPMHRSLPAHWVLLLPQCVAGCQLKVSCMRCCCCCCPQGLGEGVALPSMSNMVAAHVPPSAKARALGMSFTGFHTGEGAHTVYCSCTAAVRLLYRTCITVVPQLKRICSAHMLHPVHRRLACVAEAYEPCKQTVLHGLTGGLVECRGAHLLMAPAAFCVTICRQPGWLGPVTPHPAAVWLAGTIPHFWHVGYPLAGRLAGNSTKTSAQSPSKAFAAIINSSSRQQWAACSSGQQQSWGGCGC